MYVCITILGLHTCVGLQAVKIRLTYQCVAMQMVQLYYIITCTQLHWYLYVVLYKWAGSIRSK